MRRQQRNGLSRRPEICGNRIDDNCDGLVDEGLQTTWYLDADGDGYGNIARTTQACAKPAGYVTNNTDCNDGSAGVHPGAAELCGNGIDDNCNGLVDEDCTAPVTISISDASAYESEGAAVLTVTLSGTATQAVQVKYATAKGTASAGKDYANTKGTLTIPAGSLTQTISIPVTKDKLSEQPEYFDVQLTQAVNATLDEATGRVTILDGISPALTGAGESRHPLSAEQGSAGSGLKVTAFPNPSANQFTLLTQSDDSGTLQLRVRNNLGQTVESRQGLAANGAFYLGAHYRPGVYFVEITQGRQKQVLKLIRQ